MKSNTSSIILLSLALTATLAACSKKVDDTRVAGNQAAVVDTQNQGDKPKINTEAAPGKKPETDTAPAIIARVQIQKTLLNQKFLYGADLQYSSVYDKDMDLYYQSLVNGMIPATFVINNGELQLVADNRRLFPSNVNHPAQLISRFKIIGQDAQSVTVEAGKSGFYLTQILNGKEGKPPRDTWTRSFEIAQGNLFLQETSVLLDDGTLAEFMESIIPADNLAVGDSFEKFELNPDSPTGSWETGDLPENFMLLPGEAVYVDQDNSEKKVAYAQHFDISGGKTIDWYVTANAPDKYVPALKAAIEGWNRYFKSYKGISREVVRFLGKVPAGVKLGDPRYNIVNWDSRTVAGAAYESQASDPFTGKQSHSLVYLPAAWLAIGSAYWQNGQYSDRPAGVSKKTLENAGALARLSRLTCLRDVGDMAMTAISGRLSPAQVEDFSVELLKGVIFHEVGHALGLGHNFKGSLTQDPADKSSLFSASIMDYNNYENERAAFTSKDSSEGPLLEYDRRALSVIYDKKADLTQDQLDKPLPACNDEVADFEAGDVDPLCIRYDIEKDPTHSVVTAWERVTLEKRDGDVTLSAAIASAAAQGLDEKSLADAKDEKAFKKLAATAASAVKGAMRFYYVQNSASFGRVVRTNVKSLLNFSADTLLPGYDAGAMRERAFDGVQKAVSLFEISDAAKKAADAAKASIVESLRKTAFIASLPADKADLFVTATQVAVNAVIDSFKTDDVNGLPKVRSAVLASLARHKTIPFFEGKIGDKAADFQTAIIGLLADAAVDTGKRTDLERVAAATTLVTFKGRYKADDAIDGVLKKLEEERATAVDAAKRETAEQLLAVLTAKGPAASDKK